MQVVENYIQRVKEEGLYPNHYVVHEKRGNYVNVECENSGDRYQATNFGNNDILGFAQHPAIREASIDAIDRYGATNSSCHTLCGRIDLHRQLEQAISRFKGLPHTYLFLNAWMALQAVMDGFCHLAIPVADFKNNRETLILTDIQNHGCITSAVVNADNRSGKMLTHSPKVRTKAYRHADMDNLASKLKRFAKPDDRIIVVTDAVFSMDGDVVPLPGLISVMENYPGAVLILDEAHSSGALGRTGHGICQHFDITPQQIRDRGIEPVVMTTFSKFGASAGAAISCFSEAFTNLLDACPTSIGTISLPPVAAAAALASIRQLEKDTHLPEVLRQKTRFFRGLLQENNFEALGMTNVVPVLVDESISPKDFAAYMLKQHGVWVSPVWFIAKPRLRVVVNVLHTEDELLALVESLVKTREHLQVSGNGAN
ncbi:MAG: aminotransferase class I/II-fold pyridoxal phosphate-dependent enzyme [Gammaproteobacteria bacterium]|nr:aminotransferase class I/II-fold pyridoxal phosphate-dependent enzyme [Gammaproteobacteria bacterium]